MDRREVRFDSLADTVGFQLRRASHAVQLSYEAAFEPLGLRTSDTTVLIGIGENPGCTQADLSRNLRIKSANLVPIVAGLVSKLLVVRLAGEGRAVSLHLPDEGVVRLNEVHKALQQQEDRIEHLIPGADKEIILTALKAIAQTGCRSSTS